MKKFHLLYINFSISTSSAVTKGILENYKTKGRHLDPEDHCGFIKISNIRMYLKKFDLPRKVKAHFVCISYCGKTIYCSNLINAKGRKLKIAKSHIFRNLPCDSEVRFQIYVIHWELNRKNSFLEFIKVSVLSHKENFINKRIIHA